MAVTRQSMSFNTGANQAAKDLAARPMPELVARLYADAPPAEKSRLLELLLRPLGLLSLFALADGSYAISADHIADLVGYLEQARSSRWMDSAR
jgi:hypothetical protein